ncbi:TM2 domain-containing protein [Salinisphaera shabanensis T35B1]
MYLGRVGSGVGMLALWIVSAITMAAVVGFVGFLVLAVWWVVDAFLIPGIVDSANRSIGGGGGLHFVTESSRPKEDSMQQLERLHSLHEKGVLNAEEYETGKAKLLAE